MKDNEARGALSRLVADNGTLVARDRPRCLALLNEYLADQPNENRLLSICVELDVPARLLRESQRGGLEQAIARTVALLVDEQGLREELAEWSVRTWAIALRVTDGSETVSASSIGNSDHAGGFPEHIIASFDQYAQKAAARFGQLAAADPEWGATEGRATAARLDSWSKAVKTGAVASDKEDQALLNLEFWMVNCREMWSIFLWAGSDKMGHRLRAGTYPLLGGWDDTGGGFWRSASQVVAASVRPAAKFARLAVRCFERGLDSAKPIPMREGLYDHDKAIVRTYLRMVDMALLHGVSQPRQEILVAITPAVEAIVQLHDQTMREWRAALEEREHREYLAQVDREERQKAARIRFARDQGQSWPCPACGEKHEPRLLFKDKACRRCGWK